MGVIDSKYYEAADTCGSTECEREARNQAEAERSEAHERLDAIWVGGVAALDRDRHG